MSSYSNATTSGNSAPSEAGGGEGNGAARTITAAISASTPGCPDASRSLIVDERFFEEQFLRCQVCHERFDLTSRAPKSLPCNHTFCLPCLTQIFDHAQLPARRGHTRADETPNGTLKCPTCRVEIFLNRNKIKELPNDHRVIQMMDFLSQALARSQNVCTKHESQPLNFFCRKCLVPICRDCTVLDHKESDGHVITDVSQAMNENSAQFSKIENKSRETLEKMKARSDGLANASKRLDILQRRLKSEIKETFIEYRLLLEKRQEALVAMVHQIVQDQKAKINARFVNVCEHGTQLQKLYDEFKASRNASDIRKLFAINQQIKDREMQFTQVAAEDDNELFLSCEFEAQNEGSFLSDMSGLGEVRTKIDLDLKIPISAHQIMLLDLEEARERQRYIDNHLNDYGECEDDYLESMNPSVSSMGYDVNDSLELAGDDMQLHWPGHTTLSGIFSQYSRSRPEHQEAMDNNEPGRPTTRRSLSRRGRRSRDTNSSQVSNSIAPGRNEGTYLDVASNGSSPTPFGSPLFFERRVIRH